MKQRIYMDYNATTPLRPEVREVMLRVMDGPYNASSVHSYGREARGIIEDAREKLAALTGAQAGQVIFNSGATEGNNTVIRHFAEKRILVSSIEHPSVLQAADNLEHIPVTADGIVDLQALENLLKESPAVLVSVMLVNNETGAIQPVAEVSELAKQHGALVHCDGVQAAGRIPININTLRIDFLTLSAHKIGGPQGAGALVLGPCSETPILLHGGGQEKKARAGTENVAGIAGVGKAAELALKDLEHPQRLEKQEQLRNALEFELCKTQEGMGGLPPTFHAADAPRAANTSMFSLPGSRAENILMALDLEGIAVSNGSACSSGTVRPSHVLQAMGLSEEDASSALRISLGWATKDSDIERFLDVWSKIHARVNHKPATKHSGEKQQTAP